MNPNSASATSDSLQQLLPILDAFVHRHRNQHGASHWWSSLTVLRRALRRLDECLLRAKPSRPTTPIPRRHDAAARARWLTTHLVPRAYIAFTQLAADNQYAPLGLMLVALLARTQRVLVDFAPLQTPSIAALDASKQQARRPQSATPTPASGHDVVDHGVAVARRDVHLEVPRTKQQETAAADGQGPRQGDTPHAKAGGKGKKAKKRKGGGDVLSSLFGSLA